MNKRIVIGLFSLFVMNAHENEQEGPVMWDPFEDHTEPRDPAQETREKEEARKKAADQLARENQQNKRNQNQGGGGNRLAGGGDRTNFGASKPSKLNTSNQYKENDGTLSPNEFTFAVLKPKAADAPVVPQLSGFKSFLNKFSTNYTHKLDVLKFLKDFKRTHRSFEFNESPEVIERLEKELQSPDKSVKQKAQNEINKIYKKYDNWKSVQTEVRRINRQFIELLGRVQREFDAFKKTLNGNDKFATFKFTPTANGMELIPSKGFGPLPQPIKFSKDERIIIEEVFGNPPVELGVKELDQFFNGSKSIKQLLQEKNDREAKEDADRLVKQQERAKRQIILNQNVGAIKDIVKTNKDMFDNSDLPTIFKAIKAEVNAPSYLTEGSINTDEAEKIVTEIQDRALQNSMKKESSETQRAIIDQIQGVVRIENGRSETKEPFFTLREMVKNQTAGHQLKIEFKNNEIVLVGRDAKGDKSKAVVLYENNSSKMVTALRNLFAGHGPVNAEGLGVGTLVLDSMMLKKFLTSGSDLSWGQMMKSKGIIVGPEFPEIKPQASKEDLPPAYSPSVRQSEQPVLSFAEKTNIYNQLLTRFNNPQGEYQLNQFLNDTFLDDRLVLKPGEKLPPEQHFVAKKLELLLELGLIGRDNDGNIVFKGTRGNFIMQHHQQPQPTRPLPQQLVVKPQQGMSHEVAQALRAAGFTGDLSAVQITPGPVPPGMRQMAPQSQYRQPQSKPVTLALKQPGSRQLQDGSVITSDGIRVLHDGTQIMPSGAIKNPDGTILLHGVKYKSWDHVPHGLM